MSALQELREETQATRAWLQNFADVLGEDAEALALSVESETNLIEAIVLALTRINEVEGMADGLKEAERTMKERRQRLERQAELLKTAVGLAMETAGLKRLETALATITRKAVPPAVQIVDESQIPPSFWKRPDPVLDKRAVLAALKEKHAVPGAELTNGGETIQIKWS